ncbi:zinc-binding alcohol dehydrogenase family protein [Marinivivus vitaminiproducens]|uniref:zinc-binding alcohol dehydrogenase family protein n=1 Tax=Marinivivus vitaminiproducens TaxID=3035935 RepID=UPI0027A0419B|nr:zinc-binding alcohol dehydrogenase family protein [Geminicoccaceae bacterium SCSIO 64248]
MKAIGYRQSLPSDDPNALIDTELAMPEPGPRDIRVKVEAVSVNPVDTKVRMRAAPPEGEVKVLGYDAAGVVEAVGSEVSLFKPGEEVFYAGAIDRPGTNSEYHVVDERIVGRKPSSLSFTEAAALPLTTITAWELLFDRLGVAYGGKPSSESILIVGGAGGVGSILIQLASKLTSLTVIATASRPETLAWCQDMGAHHVIDHRQPLSEGLAGIGIKEAAYVAGLTATDRHLPEIVKVIAPQGRFAVIDDPASLDIMPFKRKSASVHWEFMFARPVFQTPDMDAQNHLLTKAAGLVDEGVLRTTFQQDYGRIDAANLRRAHQLVESGTSIGKVVLTGF